MRTMSLMTKGCVAALFVLGMTTPGLAEPLPLHYGPSPQAIVDWEDEFAHETYTHSTSSEPTDVSRSHQYVPVAPGTPIIDWEDEFSYAVSTSPTADNDQVKVRKENAASSDFEDWHLM